jgi:dihydrofolate reductase
MRSLSASIYTTLDGVVDSLEKWHFDAWNDELAAVAREHLFRSDALLLGRVTYDELAPVWPTRAGEDDFSDRMNALPKYVVTRTLDALEWNNSTLLTGHLGDEVAKLKRGDGGDVLVYGSVTLVNELLAHGLVDILRIWLHPVVLGSGKKLFTDDSPFAELTLADTTRFSSGVVLLTYHPRS